MPFRIVQVSSTLDPAAGGPPVVATRLAAALSRLGHDVTLACWSNPDAAERVKKDLSGLPGMDRVTIFDLPRPDSLPEKLFAKAARQRFDELVPQNDIIHIHGVWEPLLKQATLSARTHGKPYVITPHGMLDPWTLQQSKWKKKFALLLGTRAMLDNAGFLHALNEDERRLIEPLKLRCPVRVIPNGIFEEEFSTLPEAGTFYAAHPQLAGKPYLLFLARLHYKKGLDYLADAFAEVCKTNDDLQLVVAGPDGGAKEPFEKQIAAAGLQARVHVLPPIYGPTKYAALRDAALFILPSRQEGFSMAILEAMACGVPPVISRECHFPEVDSEGTGVVLPLEAAAFANAIVGLVNDPARRSAMGAKGPALVRARYTWPKVAELATSEYKSLRK